VYQDWQYGPYPTGVFPDIEIFNLTLRKKLGPGERVEADDGYEKSDLIGPRSKVWAVLDQIQKRIGCTKE
jgi:hypothetical protein